MIVRIALNADLDQMVDLWMELMEHHAPLHRLFELHPNARRIARHELAYRMRAPEARFFVCETDSGKLAGMIATHYYASSPTNVYYQRGYIAETVVGRAYRGQGIGERLVSVARQWLTALGVDYIELQVSPANERGLAFWKGQGFEELTYHLSYDVHSEEE